MFITQDAHRAPVEPLLARPGETYWSAIELALHQIWFLLSYSQHDASRVDESVKTNTMLLLDFAQIEHLMASPKSTRFTVHQVKVITPGYVNGTNTWQMDVLQRVWSATEPDESAPGVLIFETTSGRRYGNSLRGVRTEDLKVISLRCNLPT